MIEELNKIIEEEDILTNTDYLVKLYETKENNYKHNINDKIDHNIEIDDWSKVIPKEISKPPKIIDGKKDVGKSIKKPNPHI